MAKISVIITLYNERELIGRCLGSILKQTLRPDEIIVVDDCSTDGSYEFARQFPVNVLRTKSNSGPVEAKNVGISKSRGELIVFVDADCIVFRDWIEKAVEAIKGGYDGVTGICIPPRKLPIFTKLMWCTALVSIKNLSPTKDTLSTSNCIYRREVIEKCGLFKELDDRGMSIEARSFGYKLAVNPQCKAYHYSSKSFFHSLIKSYSYGLNETFDGFHLRRFIFSLAVFALLILTVFRFEFITLLIAFAIVYYLRNVTLIRLGWSYVGWLSLLIPLLKMLKILVWSTGILIKPFMTRKRAQMIWRET